jgi:hypothetical protein
MTDFDPICDVGRTEIPQRSDLLTSAACSIQNGPRRLKRIKELHWQTHAHSSFDPQRIFRPVANPCGR